MKRTPKDLFGHSVMPRRSRLEATLLRYDRETLEGRLARFKHLQAIFPKGYSFLSAIETAQLFDEAKMSYIGGQFVATVLLAQAHIEHCLQSYVESRGEHRIAKRGLAQIVKHLREEEIAHPFLLDHIDRLRRIRNPFSHLQAADYPESLSKRAFAHGHDFARTLQTDAEFALSLMYEVAITRF